MHLFWARRDSLKVFFLVRAFIFSIWFELNRFSRKFSFKKRGLLFCYLIQDIDILSAASKELKRQGIPHFFYIDHSLIKKTPHVLIQLSNQNIPYVYSLDWRNNKSLFRQLNLFSFVLTAVETSRRPHSPAHQLVQKAKLLGIRTYTCQHGLENVGLNYDDSQHPIKETRILSDRIFIWGKKDNLDKNILDENRNKCIETGFLKSTDYNPALRRQLPSAFPTIIGVFENLHWARFNQQYRDGFKSTLLQMIMQFPNVLFILKAHPAGKWLTHETIRLFRSKSNVLILSRINARYRQYSPMDLIGALDSIITTPSTVALDGALLGRAVAIVADNDLLLSRYQPLKMLFNPADWSTFIMDSISHKAFSATTSASFIERNCNERNGWHKAIKEIRKELPGYA